MSKPIDRDANRLDRSKCIFPSSSRDPIVAGRKSIKIVSSSTDPAHGLLPATLKAAWALTLQCFMVADVFGFRYTGPGDTDGGDGRDAKALAALYVTRIDRSDQLRSFIEKFQQNLGGGAAPRDSTGSDINVVSASSSDHQCNTAICYRAGHEQPNAAAVIKETSHQEMDIRIIVSRTVDKEMVMELDYDASHTNEDMASSVLSTFQHILAQLLNTPATLLLSDVDLCPPVELKRIKQLTSKVSPARERCLHDLIVEQCKGRPDQMAIRSWDGNMTYGELDDLSSRLANHLVQLGVRPETFVLSCFEKSTWAIVARLAILRAGGAYISIHASNPPVYLESVIVRTKTTILLTDSYFADQFRNTVPTLVELSPEWLRKLPAASKTVVCEDVQPDNACVVLFTSGSTGTPKGITQIHSSYASAIQDYARNFQLGSHTRYLQFDDYAFDISNLEFLVPLILGGVCCVPGPMKTVEDLAAQIRTLDANIIFLTPTVAIKLEPADVPGLEIMCIGGEPLPRDLVRKWANHSTRLINQYGMGEAAICCAYNDNIDHNAGAVIGRPNSGAIWVVDPSSPDHLLPVGAAGELLVEGPHLARGYIDSTALRRTEAGFLPSKPRWLDAMHPGRPPFRVYRSGDLGRLDADGNVTYLGRKDTILKLDGCRVDALEVEHQARRFLSDKDTIVVDLLGIINGQADPSLTAFLYLDGHAASRIPMVGETPSLIDAMSDPEARVKVEEIKKGIAMALPRYMVPTTFVLMAWIPRTASKKIDRKKMHVLGQVFYSAILEERTKDVDYAQRMKALPM